MAVSPNDPNRRASNRISRRPGSAPGTPASSARTPAPRPSARPGSVAPGKRAAPSARPAAPRADAPSQPTAPIAPIARPAGASGKGPASRSAKISRLVRKDRKSERVPEQPPPAAQDVDEELIAEVSEIAGEVEEIESIREEEAVEVVEEVEIDIDQESEADEAEDEEEEEADEEEEEDEPPARATRRPGSSAGAPRPSARGSERASARASTRGASAPGRSSARGERAGRLSDRRGAGASGRASRRGGAAEDEGDPKTSRRGSMRMSQRREAQPFFTLKKKILIGLVLVLGVGGAIAYNPIKERMLMAKLTEGATLDDKKAAAQGLFTWQQDPSGNPSIATFNRLLGSPESSEETRNACAFGLSLGCKSSNERVRETALTYVGETLKGSDAEAQKAVAGYLPGVAQEFAQAHSDNSMELLASALFPITGASANPDVRLAAISALAEMPAKGVCAKLLEIAKSDTGPAREKALKGIDATAIPDSVGALLTAMADESDKQLAEIARAGFAKVRNNAPVDKLVEQLGHKNEMVRLEIVKALATKPSVDAAREGLVKAFKDSATAVRLEAIAAVPKMNLGATQVAALAGPIADAEESVRVKTAEVIAELRDDTTWKLVQGAFQKPMAGKTLEAYLKTLGVRGKLRNASGKRKDMEPIKMMMDLLNKESGAEAAVREALVQLTLVAGYPRREATRRNWNKEQWDAWWSNIQARDKVEQEMAALVDDCKKHADMKYKAEFNTYYQKMVKVMEMLEKCEKMSEAEDPEDKAHFSSHERDYSQLLYHLQKNQALDLSH